MPASEMSRLESYFHHSSLNMNYPVTMELPNHPARLRQSGHVFLNTKRRGLGRLRSTTLLCLGSFQEVRMCEGGAANFHGPITYMHGFG
jgi:hypothetical protein